MKNDRLLNLEQNRKKSYFEPSYDSSNSQHISKLKRTVEIKTVHWQWIVSDWIGIIGFD